MDLDQKRDGDRGTKTPLRRRGGDHLRRRSLARGERSRERVASGQGRRDLKGRGGPVFRVNRETALDDALDERVNLLHD